VESDPEENGSTVSYVTSRSRSSFIPFRLSTGGTPCRPRRGSSQGPAHRLRSGPHRGLQGNLWSRRSCEAARVHDAAEAVRPRRAGVAPDPDWAGSATPNGPRPCTARPGPRFVNVSASASCHGSIGGPGINYRIPTPVLGPEGGVVHYSVERRGFTLRTTTDGSEPSVRSPLSVVRSPSADRARRRFSTTGRKGHTARPHGSPDRRKQNDSGHERIVRKPSYPLASACLACPRPSRPSAGGATGGIDSLNARLAHAFRSHDPRRMPRCTPTRGVRVAAFNTVRGPTELAAMARGNWASRTT